jgi:Protein of unknown function (DUF3592)
LAALPLFWHYLNSPRWWLGCLVTVVSAVGFGALYWAWTTSPEDREFAAHGIRTQAEIMFRSEVPEWEDVDGRPEMKVRYRLHYMFKDADHDDHVGVALVPKTTWLRYQLGDTLSIEYLPDQPGRNRALVRERPPLGAAGFLVLGLGALFVLGGVLLLGASWVRAWRRWRVVRRGIACLGRITEVSGSAGRNGNGHAPAAAHCHLGYTFTDERGMAHDGRTARLESAFASRWQPGDPILILYAPHDIFRHEVDLFGARTDDLNVLLNRVAR